MRRKLLTFSLAFSASVLLFSTVGLTSCTQGVPAGTVIFDAESVTLKVGESKKLQMQMSKELYGLPVYWVSTNESVAMIKNGTIMAVGEGSCQVHCYVGQARAICNVVVQAGDTPVDPDTPRLVLNTTSKTMNVGDSFAVVVVNYNPAETTFTWSIESGSDHISYTGSGESVTVTGNSVGTGVLKVEGSNNLSATCTFNIEESGGGGGGGSDYNIGVPEDLHASGSIKIGSPLLHTSLTQYLVGKFNELTGSNVSFEISPFEENEAASTIAKNPTAAPDVFPYASDQTNDLNETNLVSVSNTNKTWIRDNMGTAAYKAASLGSAGVVGFPFASDNSYVMFYDTTLLGENDIDTLPHLVAKARTYINPNTELPYAISYNLPDGFYGAGALMTYTSGTNLYAFSPAGAGDYTAESNFNSEQGLQGGRLVSKIYGEYGDVFTDMLKYPSASTFTVATITDCSKVNSMKEELGNRYGVAPLPYIDNEKTLRIGSFSGYKFYGINKRTVGSDESKRDLAEYVAKFMSSEYAQHERFERFSIKPTQTSLLAEDSFKNEPHIKALNAQADGGNVVSLTPLDSKFWGAVGLAVDDIKNDSIAKEGVLTDSELQSILSSLDTKLTKQ